MQKVIVPIPRSELKWAKQTTDHADAEMIYVGEHGAMTKEDWYAMEAQHALPFIENYVGAGFPRDRLFQIAEDGTVTQYPLDYRRYVHSD